MGPNRQGRAETGHRASRPSKCVYMSVLSELGLVYIRRASVKVEYLTSPSLRRSHFRLVLAMCHQSPTVSVFAVIVSAWSVIAFVSHIWQVDRCRVLLFSRKDAFRWGESWTKPR